MHAWGLLGLGQDCHEGLRLTGARARLSWRGARARAVLLVAVLLNRLTLTAACTKTFDFPKAFFSSVTQS